MANRHQLKMFMKLVIVVTLLNTGMALTEPCETNMFITETKRSTSFESVDDLICDSTKPEGWYRIKSGAGELMPVGCPSSDWICGTKNPIYLKNVSDVFPLYGQEVDRTAYALKEGDCLAQEIDIKIKNCTDYLVYYLRPPTGCDYGYCFGSELPCADGESSTTGFTPGCTTVFPDLTLNPMISVVETKIYGEKRNKDWTFILPVFTCGAVDATSEYAYDISFYVNDVEMLDAKYVNVSYENLPTASLQQTHWENTFRLNMLVKCAMQARYIDRGAPGKKHFSSDFFAGIKVKDEFANGVTMKEGETKTIYLTVTYPIGCTYETGKEHRSTACYISVYNGVPEYQIDNCENGINADNVAFTAGNCRRNILHDNWKEDQPLVITGNANDIVDREVRVVALRLYTPTTSFTDINELYVWKDITLPDIKVYIEDADLERYGSACESRNDPHMRTFDGVSWELQGRHMKGEYVMYKHENSPQQVNAYYTPCFSSYNALCNCGIAIRSGASIFIANFCPTGPQVNRKYNRYVISRACDDQNMLVTETGNSGYKVTLPTGTIVTFSHGTVDFPGDDPFYGIHRISITPSTYDFGLTKGLCGIYNNKDDDDFASIDADKIVTTKEEFAKQWKVTDEKDSFFRRDGILPDLQYSVQEYCTCKKVSNNNSPPEYNCESSDKLQSCGPTSTSTVYHASCISSAHTIHKREVNNKNINGQVDEPQMFDMINNDEDDNITVEDSGEWKNGLTEDIASQKCKSHIKNLPAFSVCTTYVPVLDSESFIKECIEDMKLIGSDDFLTITIQNFESQCMSVAVKMENLTDTNTTSSNGDSKNIFEVISESTCPNNCSERGSCKKGICECLEGYHGKDCSIADNEPPRLMKKAFEENCDTNIKRCENVAVPGTDFATTNLTCKLRKFTVSANNSKQIDDEGSIIAGIYSSSFLMYCPVPSNRRRRSVDDTIIATGYFVSVSNNGQTFSDELTLLIYDGSCFECNSSSLTCGKMETCPVDPVQKEDESLKLSIILGICSAIVVVCVVIIVCLKKKVFVKRKPYVTDSFVSLQQTKAHI